MTNPQSRSPVDIILGVIRGELSLDALGDAGIYISFQDHACYITTEPLVDVYPSVADIAHGLFTYKEHSEELHRWALFLMATSTVDMDQVTALPNGELVIHALWDAAFAGTIDHDVLKFVQS